LIFCGRTLAQLIFQIAHLNLRPLGDPISTSEAEFGEGRMALIKHRARQSKLPRREFPSEQQLNEIHPGERGPGLPG
jgi:hypothetical protein